MARADDIEVLEKRVVESRIYTFNFAPKMAATEAISSLTAFTSTPTTVGPTVLTQGAPVLGTQQVQVRLSGGTDGGKYFQVCKVVTDAGNTLQCEGFLLVREPR